MFHFIISQNLTLLLLTTYYLPLVLYLWCCNSQPTECCPTVCRYNNQVVIKIRIPNKSEILKNVPAPVRQTRIFPDMTYSPINIINYQFLILLSSTKSNDRLQTLGQTDIVDYRRSLSKIRNLNNDDHDSSGPYPLLNPKTENRPFYTANYTHYP